MSHQFINASQRSLVKLKEGPTALVFVINSFLKPLKFVLGPPKSKFYTTEGPLLLSGPLSFNPSLVNLTLQIGIKVLKALMEEGKR